MSLAARIDYRDLPQLAYPLLFVSIAPAGRRADDRLARGRRHPLVPRSGRCRSSPASWPSSRSCVYLAYLLARKAEKVSVFSVGFLPPLLVTGLMMVLLLKQPDLGTAVDLRRRALGLLFVAGTRTSYLIARRAGRRARRLPVHRRRRRSGMRRMLAFLDPWAFRCDVGYQITESLISVGSGGVTGLGLGDGRQKLFFLPEAHTDFILSIVGEELGLFGFLCVVGAVRRPGLARLRAAFRARDVFGAYLAFGITTMFGLQALVNIGVVLGSLPTKGLPLPFISYGGTSLVMSLFAAGVLANISARNPEPGDWAAARACAGARSRAPNRAHGRRAADRRRGR